VLEFPRNTLNAKGPAAQQKYLPKELTPRIARPQGDPVEVERATQLLLGAKKPLIIAGDGVYWSEGSCSLKNLSEFLHTPVHTRRTARGAVAEDHPLAFSGGYRNQLLRQADVICIVGLKATYLEEWFEPPDWNQDAKYIQVQEKPEEIWYALPTEVAVVGSCRAVLDQVLANAKDLAKSPLERGEWVGVLKEARSRFRNRQREAVDQHARTRPIHPHVLGARIAEFLDPDATVIFDSFTGTSYLTDKLEAKFAGQILDAGLHQPVGHGTGMCVGAQVARPGKQVLALMGDGGFGISSMDMETLLRYKLPAVVVLLNNSSWAGVSAGYEYYNRMGPWDNLPGIQYDNMFRELGCHAEHVEDADDILPALERSFNSGMPSVINVVSDSTEIHPLRLRVAFGDTWSKENLSQLPVKAQEQLRQVSSVSALQRIQKFWIDNGVYISLEELADMSDVNQKDIEKL
jgi:acetolactate synthase-1/2/3 large subunit